MRYQSPLPLNTEEAGRAGHRPMVIYVFSFVGLIIYHILKSRGYQVAAICEERTDLDRYDQIPIVKTDRLRELHPEADIVICTKYIKTIRERLLGLGYRPDQIIDGLNFLSDFDFEAAEAAPEAWRNIFSISPMSTKELFSKADTYIYERHRVNADGRVYFRSLDLVVTEKCSLRCKECSNLMQYYQNPKQADFDQLCASLVHLMAQTDYIGEMIILGGEPFLYDRLAELLNFTAKFKQVGVVKLISNGTVKPRPEVVAALKRHGVPVDLSNYRCREAVEVNKYLRDNGVPGLLMDVARWQSCGYFMPEPLEDEDRLRAKYHECCGQNLYTILHSKLYGCPFAAHADNLRAIPPDPSASLPISPGLRKEELYRFNTEQAYFYACKYCPGRGFSNPFVPVAEQISSPRPYRIYPKE